MTLEFKTSRRRFLQATGATGAVAATGIALSGGTLAPASAQQAASAAGTATVVNKNICHQCPARCGIDVYTTGGKVHAIYGNPDHPIANGKLCPKGHLGTYILYDPDRFKGPMKRTNPNKGRDQDPKFVPISWDEALNTVAARLQALRDKGESHRFTLAFGRGWGASCAGLLGTFGKLYGSPNVGLGHSSMCSDGSKKAKHATDGNKDYNSYDYLNTNYILNFGAGFLEAFRPYNNNLQVWGQLRTKSPRARVTVVDVRLTTTGAAADRLVMIKPATDGAFALAIAHVILTEGLWERDFVGDFVDPAMKFEAGKTLAADSFKEKWVSGLIEWWNAVVKDATPEWASKITTLTVKEIVTVAREFGTTRPAMALFERGPTAHTNGVHTGMAIHALNALVGSLFAKGGLAYQMGPAYGSLDVKSDDFLDDYAKAPERKKPRMDLVGSAEWPMADNQLQGVAKHHLAGNPYKIDTMMFYLTSPIFSAPGCKDWETALKDIFVIDTSPFPGETSVFADLVLPDHTYLERLQDAPTYPFQGYPLAQLRTPAVKPVHDTKVFGDILIEIGKRMKGPMGDYYKAVGNTENVIKALAKGFEKNPGDNGVNSFETWVQKGVWYKKPYHWRQVRGEFYEWDGTAYAKKMDAEEVKKKLLKTPSGKFEFKSGLMEAKADFVTAKVGIPAERVGFPQWFEAKHTGGGDLYVVTPKSSAHAEGRSANTPWAINIYQPTSGGRTQNLMEIHPEAAKKRNIADGDKVRVKSSIGTISATARYYAGLRPDTIVLPFGFGHWAYGRWAKGRGSGNVSEITENVSDPISGLACYYTGKVTVEKA